MEGRGGVAIERYGSWLAGLFVQCSFHTHLCLIVSVSMSAFLCVCFTIGLSQTDISFPICRGLRLHVFRWSYESFFLGDTLCISHSLCCTVYAVYKFLFRCTSLSLSISVYLYFSHSPYNIICVSMRSSSSYLSPLSSLPFFHLSSLSISVHVAVLLYVVVCLLLCLLLLGLSSVNSSFPQGIVSDPEGKEKPYILFLNCGRY